MKKRITDERPACPQCGTRKVVKNGASKGQQRFLCRHCGVTFHTKSPRYFDAATKQRALAMMLSGRSMRDIAETLDTSHTTVWKWASNSAGEMATRLRGIAGQLEQQSAAPKIITMEKLSQQLKKGKNAAPYALLVLGDEVLWLS